MKAASILAICTYAWAQNGVDRPQLGKMLDSNGAVRTVYGIAASVTLGDAEKNGAVSSACSKTLCLLKTETSILSTSGSIDAPAGPALFAFDGNTAFIWFSQTRQLAKWSNGALDFIDSNIDGEVLSIRTNAGSIEFAIRRRRNTWIVRLDGSVVDSLPRSTGPVMLLPDGVAYATHREIVIRDLRLRLENITMFTQMSGDYLQVRASGVDYALRIEKGRETLFQLPGVSQ